MNTETNRNLKFRNSTLDRFSYQCDKIYHPYCSGNKNYHDFQKIELQTAACSSSNRLKESLKCKFFLLFNQQEINTVDLTAYSITVNVAA